MTPEEVVPDRGSGTVYLIGIVGVLVAITMAGALVGGAVIARHRAMAGADLAALAAADALVRARPDPCGDAERVANRQGLTLVECATTGLVAEVVVSAPVNGVPGVDLDALMRARAGPAQ